jgi:hypothetical protein
MVAAERDVPGKSDAICATPTASASLQRVASSRVIEPSSGRRSDQPDDHAADDHRPRHGADAEEMLLDPVMDEEADHRRGQKREQHLADQLLRVRIAGRRGGRGRADRRGSARTPRGWRRAG